MEQSSIWKRFPLEQTLIKEYKFWYLCLRKDPNKLGRVAIILKREAFPMSEVTPEEFAEYAVVTKEIEDAIRQAFGAYLIQHMSIMFADRWAHFHLIPRYGKTVKFAEINWKDDNLPSGEAQEKMELTDEQVKLIISELKKYLP